AEHKLHRKITIMTSEQVQTPIVMGIFRPVIILPANMDLSDTELLNYVLMHEFYHIKRFDLLWKTLMAAAVCLHWFNPLAWAMLSLVNRDLELACDETVLKHFGSEKRESYAYSIIGMAEWQNLHRQIYAGFGKNAAEERIESIMKFSRKTLATMAISAAAVGAAFLVGFTAITPQVPQSADFASAENSDFAGFSANSVISEPGEIGELAELAETAESAESSETAENPKKISMQQALEIAEDFIGNPADSIVWDDNIFVVSIPEETGRYELQLDDETGQILRAELVILPETAQESEIFEPQESLTVVEVAYIPPVSQVSQAPQPTIGNITAEDARQIAMQFLGRGTIVRHETKKDYIKVCIQDGNEHHDIKVRYDGTIYKNSARPIVHTDSKALAQDRSHIISHEQAAQIALDQIGGGVVIENKLKYKSKEGLLYEITVVVGQVEHKIIVSAVGEVVKFSSKVKP
ncbi:MAG: M56 family metallopeptidase, partial [Firmicutes bacterium]|nr:M56 family metallopeptidase [Bacillota bacterium]